MCGGDEESGGAALILKTCFKPTVSNSCIGYSQNAFHTFAPHVESVQLYSSMGHILEVCLLVFPRVRSHFNEDVFNECYYHMTITTKAHAAA